MPEFRHGIGRFCGGLVLVLMLGRQAIDAMTGSRKILVRFALLGLIAAMAACQMPAPIAAIQNDTSEADRCPAAPLLTAADSAYGQMLVNRVSASAFYPREALAHGQSGQTILCLNLARNGRVIGALVLNSSGFPLLDGAALYAVGRAFESSDAGRVPAALGSDAGGLWFAVPVQFVDADAHDQTNIEAIPACLGVPRGSVYAALQQLIQKKIFYPPAAVYQGEEGKTQIQFHIAPDGEFSKVTIWKSAGDPLFDGAALITIGFVGLSSERPCLPEASTDSTQEQDQGLVRVPIDWRFNAPGPPPKGRLSPF